MYYSDNLIMEALNDDDIYDIYKFYNEYTLVSAIRNTGDWTSPSSLDEFKNEIKNSGGFVVKLKDGKVIGFANTYTNWITRISEPLLYIRKESRGNGYGKELLDLLVKIIFHEINSRKCSITVYGFNTMAIKLYKDFGFKEEGRLIDEVYRNGRYYDVLKLGLFKKDYEIMKQ